MNNAKRLGPTSLADLLAQSIKDDPAISAASSVLDTMLANAVRAIPNLLLWARLTPDAALLSPPMQRLAAFANGLKPLTDEELELLAWQEHVDFWRPHWPRPMREDLVRNATRWHRLKGTPAGIRMALALFGHAATIEEEGPGPYWATYQLGLPQIADPATVREIWEIAQEVQPARCKLWRMYAGSFDHRPIICGNGPILGDGWLSFYSGASVDVGGGNDILVSFGQRNAALLPPFAGHNLCIGVGGTSHLTATLPYIDRFVLSRSRLGDVYPRSTGFVVGQVYITLLADLLRAGRTWSGPWSGPWFGIGSLYQRTTPRWNFRWRGYDFCQCVPGENGLLGDINCRLGVSMTGSFAQPVLGRFALSAFDPERTRLRARAFSQGRAAFCWPTLPAITWSSMPTGSAALASQGEVVRAFTLSRSRLSDAAPPPAPRFTRDEVFSSFLATPAPVPRTWRGPWRGPWQSFECHERLRPFWHFALRGQHITACTLSHNAALGGINCRLGGERINQCLQP